MAVQYNLSKNLRDSQRPTPKGFGDNNYTRTASGTITSAQILAGYTTPVELIASAGEDYYIIPDELIVWMDYGTATYVGAGDVSIRYTDGSGGEIFNALGEVEFLEATSDKYFVRRAIDCVPVGGTPVVMSFETGNPTTGDGVIKWQMKYRIVNF